MSAPTKALVRHYIILHMRQDELTILRFEFVNIAELNLAVTLLRPSSEALNLWYLRSQQYHEESLKAQHASSKKSHAAYISITHSPGLTFALEVVNPPKSTPHQVQISDLITRKEMIKGLTKNNDNQAGY
jgi:hypothetical protein